jgi:hypothetical protein
VCPVDLELPKEFSKVRQCATTLGDFEEGAGHTACMCGLHFHILHFDPAQYPMMEHIRRSHQDRKVRPTFPRCSAYYSQGRWEPLRDETGYNGCDP